MSVQPARRIAFEVLDAVRSSDAYANLLLPTKIERARLSTADAALTTELTYGTLRRLNYYDRVVELAAGRPVDRIDPPVLDVLRIGAHQLLAMRTPSHAAVDESVSLTASVAGRSATGFVNAVLRAIDRSTPEEWTGRVLATARSDDERLALEHAHPVWIIRALRRALAAEDRADELAELLAADNASPRVALAALPGLAGVEEAGEPTRWSPVGVALASGDPSRVPAVAAGRVRVQDEGSQLAALALSRARAIEPGERWLDLCAGPGGKSALLGADAALGGATLVANEVVPARAGLVERAVAALDPRPEVRVGDGRTIGDEQPAAFDRILLDAPCTGLGALRRRPEARWRKSPADVAALTALQLELVASAAKALKPGGLLAYVTCSPHLAETRPAVQEAVERHGLVAVDTASALRGVTREPLPTVDGAHLQLWPHRHGTDGMFIQLLARVNR
ncbi:16S rRNA (cytosine967-C5)-methyltransferase [Diaminobutyricimonas aerilata]|uniref:16S rRNA (Cytosine967-C5)-methyltransferase n=1 Tax=Diaminobutyricimonas aerilata TaxID=1162967 RepID=A0A2M9CK64_9MICO|nr:transcription antitermination factor NusB [Diaminobutyricimonas aerilata]PJJ72274.1 16S rRNA (cytosine967-C5)-methyltransferase [Diaminobutyricimonas aerilata]